jgi:rhamnose transport system ATP-binding protein
MGSDAGAAATGGVHMVLSPEAGRPCGVCIISTLVSQPTPPLLGVEGISKRFGITQALEGVSVSFAAGEVHALMGENGAGKSTLGKIIAGLHRQDSGTVTIGRKEIPSGSLDAAFGAGVRIVHQELAQCLHLTVAENLCLHDPPRTRIGAVDRREMSRRAAVLLARIEPGIDPGATLGALSPGHRQIVQIAGVLDERLVGDASGTGNACAGRPRVIIFDEPTSSLSLTEVDRLMGIVRQLAADGLAVIYISHRMGEIFACCDRVTVLRDGKHVATTAIREIDEHVLIEQMIGRRLDLASVKRAGVFPSEEPPALEVRAISSADTLHDISISMRPGEIVGLGGLVGSGRSELLDAIFGLDKAARGQVLVSGSPLPSHNPRASVRAGIGYVPEERRLQGLFFELGVAENIVVPAMPGLATAGLRRRAAERRLARERVGEFQIKTASLRTPPGALSGGNQQKVLISRWMTPDVKVLLLDEPTRGIDVGTKAEIYRLIRAAAQRGAAVLLVSSEMPELLALSDRIAVLCEGRLAGVLSGEGLTQANILRLATCV